MVKRISAGVWLLPLFFLAVGSAQAQNGAGVGLSVGTDEIRLSTYFSGGIGVYTFEWHFPMALAHSDPYNDKPLAFSILPSAVIGLPALYILAHAPKPPRKRGEMETQNENQSRFRVRRFLLIFSPLVLLNSQHHLRLTSPQPAEEVSLRLSAFAGTRTDFFQLRETDWLRFSPKVGLRLYRGALRASAGETATGRHSRSFTVDIGAEYPLDFVRGDFRATSLRPFVSICMTELW